MLSMPKTTVWHNIKGVQLSPHHMAILKAKQGGSAKRKMVMTNKAEGLAHTILQSRYREAAIIMAMLYWAEGSKKSCQFINSDGNMIRIFLYTIKNILGIQKSGVQPTMRIFTGMDQELCLGYWSAATGIPKADFTIRLNDGGARGRTTYGMCRITVKKGSFPLKVIHALIKQIGASCLTPS